MDRIRRLRRIKKTKKEEERKKEKSAIEREKKWRHGAKMIHIAVISTACMQQTITVEVRASKELYYYINLYTATIAKRPPRVHYSIRCIPYKMRQSTLLHSYYFFSFFPIRGAVVIISKSQEPIEPTCPSPL